MAQEGERKIKLTRTPLTSSICNMLLFSDNNLRRDTVSSCVKVSVLSRFPNSFAPIIYDLKFVALQLYDLMLDFRGFA